MNREAALAVTVVATLALLGVLGLLWWRRTRRDAGIPAPVGEIPADAEPLSSHEVLYVATTVHEQPLERLAIRGLAFRSRADLTLTTAGLALDLTGQPRLFLPSGSIEQVGQATVAIDRVVERDGLVRLCWRTDAGTVVDTYLRPQNTSARAVAEEIASLLSDPS